MYKEKESRIAIALHNTNYMIIWGEKADRIHYDQHQTQFLHVPIQYMPNVNCKKKQ